MLAFITGSQAYGTAKPDSDVDLVIYTDDYTKQQIIDLSDDKKLPCKFGKLNIIFATTPQEYAAWVLGRELSCNLDKKTKQAVCAKHEFARELLGIVSDHDVHYSGEDK